MADITVAQKLETKGRGFIEMLRNHPYVATMVGVLATIGIIAGAARESHEEKARAETNNATAALAMQQYLTASMMEAPAPCMASPCVSCHGARYDGTMGPCAERMMG
jgi:cytochrome c553